MLCVSSFLKKDTNYVVLMSHCMTPFDFKCNHIGDGLLFMNFGGA